MRTLGVWLALAVVALLSGCFGPDIEMEWTDPQMSFTARSADFDAGPCPQAERHWARTVDDPDCHRVSVLVANEMAGEELDLDREEWTAVASDGGVYEAVWLDGPVTVAAGHEAENRVRFELPRGERIESLRFQDFFNEEPFVVELPEY